MNLEKNELSSAIQKRTDVINLERKKLQKKMKEQKRKIQKEK